MACKDRPEAKISRQFMGLLHDGFNMLGVILLMHKGRIQGTLSSATVMRTGVASRLERSSGAQCERKGCAGVAAARAACLAGLRPAATASAGEGLPPSSSPGLTARERGVKAAPAATLCVGAREEEEPGALSGWQVGQQYTVRPDMSHTCTAWEENVWGNKCMVLTGHGHLG